MWQACLLELYQNACPPILAFGTSSGESQAKTLVIAKMFIFSEKRILDYMETMNSFGTLSAIKMHSRKAPYLKTKMCTHYVIL